MARKIEVEILGDSRSLQRALGQAGKSGSTFGRVMGSVVRGGAIAAGAAMAGLGVAAKIGFDEFSNAAKVGAQTNAVLKSTKGVANVTAKSVENLGRNLMELSGIDDEVIKSGENMLLTFRGIRNEAGKNNDIFDQATKATLDLSVAMGRDMSDSAIMVGKALQDPIRGLTAMRRVGIQFTTAQEAQIKKMVEAGDVMGAQKMILKELNTEFGGSAKALGETLPGAISRVRESFRNFLGDLVGKVAPAVQEFLGTFTRAKGFKAKLAVAWTGLKGMAAKLIGAIDKALAQVSWDRVGATIVAGIVSALQTARTLGTHLAAILRDVVDDINWEELGKKLGPGLATMLLSALAALLDPEFWARNWALMLTLALTIFKGKFFVILWRGIRLLFKGLGDLARGVLLGAAPRLAAGAGKWVTAIVGKIRDLPRRAVLYFRLTLVAIGQVIGSWIALGARLASRMVTRIVSSVSPLARRVVGKIGEAVSGIRGEIGQWVAAGLSLGRALVDGIISGLSGLFSRAAGAIAGQLKSAIGSAKGALGIDSPSKVAAKEIGEPLALGVLSGFASAMSRGNLATPALAGVGGSMGGRGGGTSRLVQVNIQLGKRTLASALVDLNDEIARSNGGKGMFD